MAKTSTGFEFEILPGAFDDWELIELIAELSGGNTLKVPAVLERLIGKDAAKELKEHCRVDGRVPASAMNAEITEIIALMGEDAAKKKG